MYKKGTKKRKYMNNIGCQACNRCCTAMSTKLYLELTNSNAIPNLAQMILCMKFCMLSIIR